MTKIKKVPYHKKLFIGKKIGLWTVIGDVFTIPIKYKSWTYNRKHVMVRCDCGTEKDIIIETLRCGKSRSCGCNFVKSVTKHGMSRTRLGNIYRKAKYRCCNPNSDAYHNYRGRGITMCDEWLDNPISFYKWALKNGYNDTLTIDREDNNKGYSPENCRWVTMMDQLQNQRITLSVILNGKKMSLKKASRLADISYNLSRKLYHQGKNFDDILMILKNK